MGSKGQESGLALLPADQKLIRNAAGVTVNNSLWKIRANFITSATICISTDCTFFRVNTWLHSYAYRIQIQH